MTASKEQIESAYEKLRALAKELTEIKTTTEQSVNVFRATGMGVQEVKHSAFLAWLLDPQMPHGLCGDALKLFCRSLIEYNKPRDDFPNLTNKSIIGNKLDKLDELLSLDKRIKENVEKIKSIQVNTERVIVDSNSRTDIIVVSPTTQTIIVIENKVFTGAHDDQLNRYNDQVNRHEEYKNYEQIYVYLTRLGSAPRAGDGDDNWCLFDYGSVLKIAENIHNGLSRTKEHTKLKILLEDYMELVDTDIIQGNKSVRALCRKIVKEHAEALAILKAYTDNAEEAIKRCRNWIELNCPDIHIYRQSDLGFAFYTERMKTFFENNGDNIIINATTAKCTVIVSCQDGPVTASFCLNKNKADEWSKAQTDIMHAVEPKKKAGDLYFSFYEKTTLLSEEERAIPFEEIDEKTDLTKHLEELIQKIRNFDETLSRI